MRPAAGQNPGALFDGIAHMSLDLRQRRRIDERALQRAILDTGRNLHGRDGLGERPGVAVVNAVLDEDAIGAYTGLPCVAEFGSDRTAHGLVDIGVVEDNQRSVTAEFEADALHRIGTLAHEQLAGRRGSREGELAHDRALHPDADDIGRRLRRHHADNTGGDAGLFAKTGKRQRRKRRVFGRLDDDSAAGGKRRADLAGDHRQREVPRRDRRNNTNRLLHDDDAGINLVRRHDATMRAAALFGKPGQKASRIGDFAARLGKRLALLGR